SWLDLGDVRRDRGEGAEALASHDRALRLLGGWLERAPQDRAVSAHRGQVQVNRGIALYQLRRFREATAAWEQALEADTGPVRHLLSLARALSETRLSGGDAGPVFREHYADALKEEKAMRETAPLPGGTLYLLACIHALAADLAARD